MTTKNLDVYIDRGYRSKDWYAETEVLLTSLFGADRLYLVTQLFAATSIKTTLKANIKLFRRALHEIETDKPFSNYLYAQRFQLDLIRSGQPIQARKIRSFAAAMSGDVNAVVVDRWLMRAFGYDGERSPTNNQYTLIEDYVRVRAHVKGLQPRELSAIIWSGIRPDLNNRYHETLQHQLYNMYE